MNKRTVIAVIASMLAMTLLLGGCGAGIQKSAESSSMSALYEMRDDNGSYYYETEMTEDMSEAPLMTDSAGRIVAEAVSERKIIMTANYTVETKQYDDSYSEIITLTERLGGYISASDYRGISLDSYGSRSRYCTMTARVPAADYREFTDSLSGIGNVSYSSESTSDVTTQYFDLQARIDSLNVQEKRLLELLEKAETVDDILRIETQLSDVRYQIESFQSNFKALSNAISYSTVTIELKEVIEYSKEPVKELTFGEKIVRGLSDGWDAFLTFGEGFVLVLLVCLPFLVLIAALTVVIVLLCKRAKKRRAKRAAEAAKAARESVESDSVESDSKETDGEESDGKESDGKDA